MPDDAAATERMPNAKIITIPEVIDPGPANLTPEQVIQVGYYFRPEDYAEQFKKLHKKC
jgi:hypothetical protein